MKLGKRQSIIRSTLGGSFSQVSPVAASRFETTPDRRGRLLFCRHERPLQCLNSSAGMVPSGATRRPPEFRGRLLFENATRNERRYGTPRTGRNKGRQQAAIRRDSRERPATFVLRGRVTTCAVCEADRHPAHYLVNLSNDRPRRPTITGGAAFLFERKRTR